jgi:hypothetical protein
LLGARFIGHPLAPQFQDARIVVEGQTSIGRGLAPGWTMNDEWYSFKLYWQRTLLLFRDRPSAGDLLRVSLRATAGASHHVGRWQRRAALHSRQGSCAETGRVTFHPFGRRRPRKSRLPIGTPLERRMS